MSRSGKANKGCLFLLAVFLLPAILMPFLGRGPMQRARERMILADIGTIQTAAARYQSQFGRYPASLDELGAHSSLIQSDLASGVTGGYEFTLQGGPSVYTVNANPVNFGWTGKRTFYTDQTKVVRENKTPEPASAASAESTDAK